MNDLDYVNIPIRRRTKEKLTKKKLKKQAKLGKTITWDELLLSETK